MLILYYIITPYNFQQVSPYLESHSVLSLYSVRENHRAGYLKLKILELLLFLTDIEVTTSDDKECYFDRKSIQLIKSVHDLMVSDILWAMKTPKVLLKKMSSMVTSSSNLLAMARGSITIEDNVQSAFYLPKFFGNLKFKMSFFNNLYPFVIFFLHFFRASLHIPPFNLLKPLQLLI